MRPWPGAEEERTPAALTFSESFSRDAVALLESGGRDTDGSPIWYEGERTRLVEGSPERSESDGREMDPEGACFCFAGLLMRRLRSRWPLASRSDEKPEDLCELENERAPWRVCEGEGEGLGV